MQSLIFTSSNQLIIIKMSKELIYFTLLSILLTCASSTAGCDNVTACGDPKNSSCANSYWDSGLDQCNLCSNIAGTDPNAPTAAGSTECTCYEGLFWNSANDPPTCDACSNATEADCGVKSPSCFNFYWDETLNCTECESAPETDCGFITSCIDYYFDYNLDACSACNLQTAASDCGPGTQCPFAFYNSTSSLCQNCDNVTVSWGCGVFTGCPDFYYNSSSGVCDNCQDQVLSNYCGVGTYCPDSFYNSTLDQCTNCDNTTVCGFNTQCPDAYFNSSIGYCVDCDSVNYASGCGPGTSCPDAYFNSTRGFCVDCDSVNYTSGCGNGSSCPNSYFNTTTKICNNCDSVKNSTTCNSKCLNFYFSNQSICVLCSAAGPDGCGVAGLNCINYLLNGSSCVACSSINFTAPKNVSTANPSACSCQLGYYWNSTSLSCVSCVNAGNSTCGISSNCLNFIWNTTKKPSCSGCSNISNTIQKNSSTPSVCACQAGYIWNPNTTTCVQCDWTKGGALINNVCVSCASIVGITTPITKTSSNYSCICGKNYIFNPSSKTCYCNSTAGLFDLFYGNGCAACSSLTGSTGQTTKINGLAACKCQPGYQWNATQKACLCSSTTSYFVPKVGCKLCSSLAISLKKADPNNPFGCLCPSTFVWDNTVQQCVCASPNNIVKNGACLPCSNSVFASTGVNNGSTACACAVNLVWSAASLKCICNSLSISLPNGTCVQCSAFPTTNGRQTATSCNCQPNFLWTTDNTGTYCKCLNPIFCQCSSGYILVNSRCVPCSSYSQTTGASKGNTCVCQNSATVWSSTTLSCICPSGSYFYNQTICVICNYLNNAISAQVKGSTFVQCNCRANHKWIPGNATCTFVASSKTIVTAQGTNFTCPSLAWDNFNCICANDHFWNDISRSCVACSTISGSSTGSKIPITCTCQPNLYWDPAGYACSPKLTINIFQLPNNHCKGPNGATLSYSKLTTSETVFRSSDDHNIANIFASDTLYNSLSAYKCVCPSTYLFSPLRRRCYASTLVA